MQPLLVGCFILLFIIASFHFFYWAGIDDDLITLWSGETLGKNWWFINFNGERSEMTSSILAAFVAKIAYWIAPQATYLLNKILLFLFAPAALWLLWQYRKIWLPENTSNNVSICTIAAAASMPFLQYWSQSSLESPLHAFLLTWYTFLLISYAKSPSDQIAIKLIVAQLLLILVRPEGFWAIGITCMMFFHIRKNIETGRIQSPIYLIPTVGFFLLLTFRYAATGFLFSNAFYAKIAFGYRPIISGSSMIWQFYHLNVAQELMGCALITALIITFQNIIKNKPLVDSLTITGLTAVIIADLGFFLIVGGDQKHPVWTYRLLAPVTLLQSCLLFHLLVVYGHYIQRYSQIALVLITLLIVIDNTWTSEKLDKIPKTSRIALRQINWSSSLKDINIHVLKTQYAHGQDFDAVYNFISHDMAKQIHHMRNIRILTYQDGFFPYYVKNLYPDAQISFFDSRGLMDPHVGLAGHSKGSGGLHGAMKLSSQLKSDSAISRLIRNFNPNMIYSTASVPHEKSSMKAIGWRDIYDRPFARIWIKK